MKTNVEERKKLNNDKTALSEKKGGCWSIFNCCSCGTNQGAEEEINLNNGNIEEKIEEKINESNIKNDNNNQNLSNSLVIKEEIKSNVLVEKNSQSFKENNINYSQNNYIDGSLCEKEKNIEEIKSAEKQSLVNISEEENKNKDIFTNIANGKKKETCIMKKEEINENLVNNDKNINKSNFTPLENIQLIEFNNSYVKEYARKNGLNINDNFDLSALKQQNTFNNNISNNINNNNLNSNININNGKRTIVEVKEQGENEKKDMEKDDSFFTMSGIIQGTHFNNNKNIDIINKGNNNNNFDLKPIELIQPQDINKVNLNNNNFEFTPIKLINLSGFNNSIDYKNTNLIDSKRHKGTIMDNEDLKGNIKEEKKELDPIMKVREKEEIYKSNIRLNGKYSDIKKGEIDENLVNKDKNINNNFKGNKGSGDEFFIKGDGMNYSMYVGTIRLNKPDNKSFCSGKDKKIEFTLQFKREQKGKEDCLKEYKMILERVGEGELKVTMHDVKNKTDIEVKILNNETVKENIKKDFEKIVDKIARSENKKNIIDLILSTVKNNFFVDNLKKLNLSDDIIKEIVPEPFLDYYNATHEKGKVIKKYDFYMSGIIQGNQFNNNKNINIINNNPNNNININNGERTIAEVKKQGENEKKDMENDNGFFTMSGIIGSNQPNNNKNNNNNNFEFKDLGLIEFRNIDINKYAEENNNNNNIDLVNNRKKETRIIKKEEINKNIANKNKNINTINNLKEKNNDIIINSGEMIKNASGKGGESKDNIKNSNNSEIKSNNLDVEAGKLATRNNQ